MRNCEYVLTEEGRRKVARYIRELEAKRKEILDAGLDTIDETPHCPDEQAIIDDLNWGGVDEDGEYLNGWYVTDNYDSDWPICLHLGEDFIESCSEVMSSTARKFTKYPQGYTTITSTDRISLKENIHKYLADNNIYKALHSYEQSILTEAWSSEDPQVYLLGAIFALNSAGVSTTKEFKHIIYLVTNDVNDSKEDNK